MCRICAVARGRGYEPSRRSASPLYTSASPAPTPAAAAGRRPASRPAPRTLPWHLQTSASAAPGAGGRGRPHLGVTMELEAALALGNLQHRLPKPTGPTTRRDMGNATRVAPLMSHTIAGPALPSDLNPGTLANSRQPFTKRPAVGQRRLLKGNRGWLDSDNRYKINWI